MAIRKTLVCAAAVMILELIWACEVPPKGCTLSNYLAPVTLKHFKGVWYLQAYIYSNINIDCSKYEFIINESGQNGQLVHSYRNRSGSYDDRFLLNLVRPGYHTLENIQESSYTTSTYAIFVEGCRSVLQNCLLFNGTYFGQDVIYLSRKRSVDREEVLNAFNITGVLSEDPVFVSQINCRN